MVEAVQRAARPREPLVAALAPGVPRQAEDLAARGGIPPMVSEELIALTGRRPATTPAPGPAWVAASPWSRSPRRTTRCGARPAAPRARARSSRRTRRRSAGCPRELTPYRSNQVIDSREDLLLLRSAEPADEGVGRGDQVLDEAGVRPVVGVRVERAVRRPVGQPALDRPVEVAHLVAAGLGVGAVDRVVDRRDAALQPGEGLGEPDGVVLHALAERREHVLEDGRARAEQRHPVVAEVAPGQRVRPSGSAYGAALGLSLRRRHGDTLKQICLTIPTVEVEPWR